MLKGLIIAVVLAAVGLGFLLPTLGRRAEAVQASQIPTISLN